MIILGIDTATRITAVGVCRAGRIEAERGIESRREHAADLPALVREVLEAAGAAPQELDGIAVSAGPGSFTGLRVGISFVKGLSYATGAPVVAVPTLHALVLASGEEGCVGACLDARRGEVYGAVYEVGGGIRERIAPVALAPQMAADRFRDLGARIVVGDAAPRYRGSFESCGIEIRDLAAGPPRGGIIAVEGEARLARGEQSETARLTPFYVRAAEAEIRLRGPSLTLEKTL